MKKLRSYFFVLNFYFLRLVYLILSLYNLIFLYFRFCIFHPFEFDIVVNVFIKMFRKIFFKSIILKCKVLFRIDLKIWKIVKNKKNKINFFLQVHLLEDLFSLRLHIHHNKDIFLHVVQHYVKMCNYNDYIYILFFERILLLM